MEFKGTKGKWYLQKFSDVYTNIIRCDNGKGFETLYIANLHGEGGDNRENAKLISMSLELFNEMKETNKLLAELIADKRMNNILKTSLKIQLKINQEIIKEAIL